MSANSVNTSSWPSPGFDLVPRNQSFHGRPLCGCPAEINGGANLCKKGLHSLDLALLVFRGCIDYDVFGLSEFLWVFKSI